MLFCHFYIATNKYILTCGYAANFCPSKSNESHSGVCTENAMIGALILSKDSCSCITYWLVRSGWARLTVTRPLTCQPTLYCTPSTTLSAFPTKNNTPKPTQPPIQWEQGVCSWDVKWLRHEVDHSPESNVQANTTSGAKHLLPLYTLKKAQGKLCL